MGYERVYYRNYGTWGGLGNFEGHAFVFRRFAEIAEGGATIHRLSGGA